MYLYMQLCLFLRDTYLLINMRTMFVIKHMTLVYDDHHSKTAIHVWDRQYDVHFKMNR